jgi:hypothetical protein
MEKIIFKGAVNPLSFGNVSYNLLKAMYKKDMHVAFFPISDNLNFEAFDKIDQSLKDWIVDIAQNRFHLIDKEMPTFSQWHLSGSESRISKHQTLFTFYESDEPTPIETSICSLQDNCVFSSKHAADCFRELGCENVYNVPIGFDDDLEASDEDYLPDQIHFGLMGKFENRKNTAQILRNWASKYGNNDDYQLSCCISNPFFKTEDLNGLISKALDNKPYSNINFIPHLKTNSEVNQFMNAIDIDLTGLSGAEGWNLPSFNCTALGKWSIVMNHTSHKDWANSKNSILVEPEEKVEIYDSAFFHKGNPFNQGHMHKISDELMIDCFEKSEKFYGKNNKEGVKLQKEFTYEKTLNKILEIINNER